MKFGFGRRQRWDLEVDVLSLGSGLGGITAAIVAHDLGREAAVLDKSPKLGGVCAYSGGETFNPNNRQMRAAGIEDSEEDARAYFDFIGAGFNEPELTDRLMASRHEALDYLTDNTGIDWVSCANLADYYYPGAPGSHSGGRYLVMKLFSGAELGEWQTKTHISPHHPQGLLHEDLERFGGLATVKDWDYEMIAERIENDQRSFGPAMMGYLIKAAVVDRQIPAYVETPARELLTDDDGAVIGVRAEREGRDFFVRARQGVVMGIGGYDHNVAMATQFENTHEWGSACPPGVDGDNIVLGGEIGAAVANVPPTNLAMFFGYNIPGEEHFGKPLYRTAFESGIPHSIVVNRDGERFCDESFYKDTNPRQRLWDGHKQEYKNLPAFMIFDTNYRERYPVGSFMPGQPMPEGFVEQADSPRELAAKLGVDPEGFERTLQHFNANAEKGEDPDFGRGQYLWARRLAGDPSYPNPNLAPVSRAPFYGLRLTPIGVGINSHGLRFDRDARAVHVRGHAIPGFYVVGNSAALLDIGGGYQSGMSNLRAITWGYLAGKHAAGRAR
ncbi:MAG: FAD-binding protein [Myxococcota bacterium]|nr:FAD-binding protein [Myxococcota bacterium]